jgi:hypothetical protein
MLTGNYIRKLLIVLLFRISFRMAKKFGGRRRNYITKLARIVVAYLVRNCQKQICLLKELLYQITLARIAVASVVRNRKLARIHVASFVRTAKTKYLLYQDAHSNSCRNFFENCNHKQKIVCRRNTIRKLSLELRYRKS